MVVFMVYLLAKSPETRSFATFELASATEHPF